MNLTQNTFDKPKKMAESKAMKYPKEWLGVIDRDGNILELAEHDPIAGIWLRCFPIEPVYLIACETYVPYSVKPLTAAAKEFLNNVKKVWHVKT